MDDSEEGCQNTVALPPSSIYGTVITSTSSLNFSDHFSPLIAKLTNLKMSKLLCTNPDLGEVPIVFRHQLSHDIIIMTDHLKTFSEILKFLFKLTTERENTALTYVAKSASEFVKSLRQISMELADAMRWPTNPVEYLFEIAKSLSENFKFTIEIITEFEMQ